MQQEGLLGLRPVQTSLCLLMLVSNSTSGGAQYTGTIEVRTCVSD
jgi:hypothetical protein